MSKTLLRHCLVILPAFSIRLMSTHSDPSLSDFGLDEGNQLKTKAQEEYVFDEELIADFPRCTYYVDPALMDDDAKLLLAKGAEQAILKTFVHDDVFEATHRWMGPDFLGRREGEDKFHAGSQACVQISIKMYPPSKTPTYNVAVLNNQDNKKRIMLSPKQWQWLNRVGKAVTEVCQKLDDGTDPVYQAIWSTIMAPAYKKVFGLKRLQDEAAGLPVEDKGAFKRKADAQGVSTATKKKN